MDTSPLYAYAGSCLKNICLQGIDTSASADLPTKVGVWVTNSLEGPVAERVEETTLLPYVCLRVNFKLLFLRSTAQCSETIKLPKTVDLLENVKCECIEQDRGLCPLLQLRSCASFVLRHDASGLCLFRLHSEVLFGECSFATSSAYQWHFNKQTEAIEGIESASSYVDSNQHGAFVVSEEKDRIIFSAVKSTIICSQEGDICSCEGQVYFGRLDRTFSSLLESGDFKMLPVASSIPCTNTNFGGDPNPGFEKQCWCVSRLFEAWHVSFEEHDGKSILLLHEASNSTIKWCIKTPAILGATPGLEQFPSETCSSFLLY